MVKYYIKITNEKPLDDDSALWFELESDEETGKADFFVLDRNEYTALVQKFKDVQHSYDVVSANFNDSVIDQITPTIESYIASLPSTVDGAYSLVDSENSENTYDYSSLTTALSNLETDYNTTLGTKLNTSSVDSSLRASSTNPGQNKVVKSALDGKANSSTVTSLQTSVNGKANSSHNHHGWTYLKVNDYCTIYHNDQLKLVFCRYYRSSYSFSSTNPIKGATIPSAYRPRLHTVLACYSPYVGGHVDGNTGEVNFFTTSKGSHQINATAMWFI